ncbi:hypothetical protein [Stutzerimonas stutzeri]|uniref:hypothetical protein n=1 Tax=Stutzerimonas stutzeri TaxID=316 RepID=UPI0015E32E16|nr:hypothetical protein [Stutzerimonas stutzeri]MBA1280408.1 hypothetical protein [Stutzerimonas stutzeri]
MALKNNKTSADHAPGCPFTQVPTSNIAPSAESGHSPTRIRLGGHVALHSEFQSESKGIARQISRSSAISSPHRNGLLSMLMSLAELAELGVYCPARPVPLGDQYAALRHAASRFVLHPGIPLDHVLDTRISAARLVRMAKRLREMAGFGESRRYGLLMDVIKSTSSRRLITEDGAEMDFFGNAEALHGRRAPLLTLATVTTEKANSGYYQLGKAAYIPVLSPHHLFPVVDDLDRETVNEVFALMRWLHAKKQIQATASRDIFQAGAGYGMLIRSGGQLVEVDLNPSILDGPAPRETVLSLSAMGSIETLKKRLIVMLIKGKSGE